MTVTASTAVPERALPAPLHDVHLTLTRRVGWDQKPDHGPSFWYVSADVVDLELDEATEHVGDFTFVRLEPTETRDLFGVLDGYDGDLGLIAEMILDVHYGDFRDDLDEFAEPGHSDMLVLYQARLEERWRGFGLGAVLAGQAILQLGGGCRGVVCQAASIDPSTPEAQSEAAALKVAAAWEKIGFARYREDILVLNLGVTTFTDALAAQRARLTALAHAHD